MFVDNVQPECYSDNFPAFHNVEVAMSRPRVSLTGFATLFGALPTLMPAFRPVRASEQAAGPLNKLDHAGGLGVRRASVESRVIPAEDKFRGGDVLTLISIGGPLAHDHSLGVGK